MNNPSPAPARPSATIVVVRDGNPAPEILLVRRRAGDAFGDTYAFPGGVVDRDEANAHVFCSGRPSAEAEEILGDPDGLDYYSAAIRELFEETGILLARDSLGNWAADGSAMSQQRVDVDKGRLPWPDFLQQKGFCMAADALHYFAYWETPIIRPKRWQTRFFVAELPPGQNASHDGVEVTDIRWVDAVTALTLGEDGELPMPFPTNRILRSLAEFTSVPKLVRWAKSRPAQGVEKIRPVVIRLDGKSRILIPGDPGYDEADQS
jgi:8-oxo-dGTP pyrophosphatase MutT (NUDIX family)